MSFLQSRLGSVLARFALPHWCKPSHTAFVRRAMCPDLRLWFAVGGVLVTFAILSFGQADLFMGDLQFSPTNVFAGDNFGFVSWKLFNGGPQSLVNPDFHFEFFVSANEVIGDADDLKIDDHTIPNFGFRWPSNSVGGQGTPSISIPATVPAGDYFLIGRIKPIATDPDLSNNLTRSQQKVSIIGGPTLIPSKDGEGFRVSFQTRTNKTYTLEFKPQLEGTAWTPVASITGDGSVQTLLDPNPLDTSRFYRVRVAN